MKIGFLTERLLLGFGVDLVVDQHAAYLSSNGHHVEVYCQRHEASARRAYEVIDISAPDVPTIASSQPRDLVKLANYLNNRDIDVWIITTPPYYDLMPLLARPAIAVEHGTPPSVFFKPEIGRHLDATVAYRFRHVFPRLRPQDRILCISRSIQNWLPANVHAFSDIVYNGCDHYARATVEEIQDFRQNLKLNDGPVILWVGRVQVENDEQPYKGFAEFIELVQRARKIEPGLQFVVVGRGGEKEEKFLRSRNIIPCLNLPGEKMGAAFASCDLFLNTSLWEGFNLPLLEAQYQGRPVLS